MAIASPSYARRRSSPRRPQLSLTLPHRSRAAWFDIYGAWLDMLAANGMAETTISSYGGALLRMICALRMDPGEITEETLADYFAGMKAKGSTVEMAKRAAKSYYAYAVRRGHHLEDPAAAFRYKAPKYGPAESLTRREFHAAAEILDASRDPRRLQAILLLLETGARIGSMAAVAPEHTGTEPGSLIRFEVAKFDKPYAVPLSDAGAAAVRRLLPGERGLLIGRAKNTLWHWWHDAARRSGLQRSKWRAHILRDTFATNLLSRGVDVRVVQELLNHQDLTTMTRYAAVTHRRMRAAIAGASVLDSFPE